MRDSILVFGASGFVGSALTHALAERDERVIAVSRRPVDLHMKNVEVITSNLSQVEHFLPLLKRSRVVVYAASCSTPGSSADRPMEELQHNLRPLVTMLQALQCHPQTELLYLSSGGSLYSTNPGESAKENSAIQPRSYHGASKVAAEHFIGAWCSQYDGSATILRPSNLYGPGQIVRAGFGIVPACMKKISRGETLSVWGDGSVVRDYLYIDDFIKLCVAVAETPAPVGHRPYNAASGIGISLNTLFDTLQSVTGKFLYRDYDASRAVDAPYIVMDAGSAKEQFGWSAGTSLREGLEKTWAWFNTTQP
ncbi:NAD-dependent epimerase/dehydratase family protein [Rhodanobacter hydrolyticus]|uniref:NAD-dependent epimerase/dehydratase family protein n=1 Tax=Rhodanobacter hydrolyticus TaxID=2250595 RepID=A0ABW8J9M9_9GAMM